MSNADIGESPLELSDLAKLGGSRRAGRRVRVSPVAATSPKLMTPVVTLPEWEEVVPQAGLTAPA